jgi:hypothetical protein
MMRLLQSETFPNLLISKKTQTYPSKATTNVTNSRVPHKQWSRYQNNDRAIQCSHADSTKKTINYNGPQDTNRRNPQQPNSTLEFRPLTENIITLGFDFSALLIIHNIVLLLLWGEIQEIGGKGRAVLVVTINQVSLNSEFHLSHYPYCLCPLSSVCPRLFTSCWNHKSCFQMSNRNTSNSNEWDAFFSQSEGSRGTQYNAGQRGGNPSNGAPVSRYPTSDRGVLSDGRTVQNVSYAKYPPTSSYVDAHASSAQYSSNRPDAALPQRVAQYIVQSNQLPSQQMHSTGQFSRDGYAAPQLAAQRSLQTLPQQATGSLSSRPVEYMPMRPEQLVRPGELPRTQAQQVQGHIVDPRDIRGGRSQQQATYHDPNVRTANVRSVIDQGVPREYSRDPYYDSQSLRQQGLVQEIPLELSRGQHYQAGK